MSPRVAVLFSGLDGPSLSLGSYGMSSMGSDAHGWADAVEAAELYSEIEALPGIVAGIRTVQLAFVSAFVLLLYEYMITFDREVNYAWGRKMTWAKGLFFLNRYLSLFQVLTGLVSVFLPASEFVCVHIFAPPNMLKLIVAAELLHFATGHAVLYDCTLPGLGGLGLLTRITLILSEALVIVATAIHTWATYRRKTRQTQTFACLVLREGALYFLAQLVLNIVQIMSTVYFEIPQLSVVCLYLGFLPSILISRFYLNLDDLREHELHVQRSRSCRWKPLPPAPARKSTVSGDLDDNDCNPHYVHEVLAYNEKLVHPA
ncbi:hypothetical protein C8Q76DRAFT_859419 [Earliella scabrosa]|nr:hypothetical protein C8Q76DRAFT_859419 [Earliella scabrosa]